MTWVPRILAGLGLLVVTWVLVTALAGVVHGHPAYAVLLGLTIVGSAWALWLHRTRRPGLHGWRRVGSTALAVGALGWVAMIFWLTPFTAQEPALSAMTSDAQVAVTESATRIVMTPAADPSATSVFFQPGARVEARAYAGVLRPIAEAGYRVVLVKQPLGIAFLALGTFGSVQDAYPEATGWVLAGHSLGGTVAAIQADDNDQDEAAAVRGLLFHASFPASDLSESLTAQVLSVSGTRDGLATPADVEASRPNLPADARFEAIDGAVHAFFGDYGPQPGDGQPGISHDQARAQISRASVEFVTRVAGAN
ncbi:MAG: alpha/beta family hydrolase [Candidatus Nanopelagicales bacterium]